MSDKKRIFVSYAREDREIARQLYDAMKRAGLEPWLDVEDLLPGQLWKTEIRQAIQESQFFVAVLSSSAISKRGHQTLVSRVAYIVPPNY